VQVFTGEEFYIL